MAWLNILHPFMIQMDHGGSLQFHVGEGYVPDDLLGHPRVVANTAAPSVALEAAEQAAPQAIDLREAEPAEKPAPARAKHAARARNDRG